METIPGGDNLYTFECLGQAKHRQVRKTITNPAPCSHCGKPFHMIATVERIQNEGERTHMYRALTVKAQAVH